MVDPVSGRYIVESQVVQDEAGQPAFGTTFESTLFQILEVQIPGIANGTVDVTDMELVSCRQNALCSYVA